MTAIPAEVAAELTRLRAENARLLRLLKLTPQQAAPPGPAQAARTCRSPSLAWTPRPARVESKRLVVIPVLLTPSLFEETALARFQAANPPGRPLSVMPRTEAERALVDIAGRLTA